MVTKRKILAFLVLAMGLAVTGAATLLVFTLDFMTHGISALVLIPYSIFMIALGITIKIAFSKLGRSRPAHSDHWGYNENDPDMVSPLRLDP